MKIGGKNAIKEINNSLIMHEKYLKDILNYSLKYESKLNHSKMNMLCEKTLEQDILSSLVFRSSDIRKNCIYSLSGNIKVIQILKNGIIARLEMHDRGTYPENIFIYTKKSFVDGEFIGKGNVYYSGPYSYGTVLGSKKTVHSFKEIELNKFYFLFSNIKIEK